MHKEHAKELDRIYELCEQGKVDAAIDVALEALDRLYVLGDAEQDAWLALVDMHRARPGVVVAMLTYTRYIIHAPNSAGLIARFEPVLVQAVGETEASTILLQVQHMLPSVSPDTIAKLVDYFREKVGRTLGFGQVTWPETI